jgi:hypothetical protein
MAVEPLAVRIPLGLATWRRSDAQEPDIFLLNRYYEQDPTNIGDEQQVALLARPALRRWITGLGDGPIRGTYSQPGTFADSLFVVSDKTLYRVNRDETVDTIGDIGETSHGSVVSFAATDDPFLFLCDGGTLYLYTEDGFASGTLTASAVANNDTVTIDTIYYKWTNASVDAGTPAGTLANPWLVALGGSGAVSLSNLLKAINDSGVPGVDYSTALVVHPTVIATSTTVTTLSVRAKSNGTGGNSISTTETGGTMSWGAATLTGGGTEGLTQVPTPDDVGIRSVGYIASFVICVAATDDSNLNGRFFWIEPFEAVIEPLNFATAEQRPDPLWNGLVVGDLFCLPGSNSTEVWQPTGDELVPFLRIQARAFNRGTWEGTALAVEDDVVLVDLNGIVWLLPGGAGDPVRVSTHAIEQRIRDAMQLQTVGLF